MAILVTGAAGFIGYHLSQRLLDRVDAAFAEEGAHIEATQLRAALQVAAAQTSSPIGAAILLAATLGVADLSVSSCWSICHDIGGRHAGIVTGAMNTWGNIGGALSPLVVGYAVGWWNSWTVPFYITAGVYMFGALCTFFVDPRKPVSLAR